MCIVVGGVEREVRRGLVDGGWVLGGEMRGLVVVTDRTLEVVQVLLWGLDVLALGDLNDLVGLDLDDLDRDDLDRDDLVGLDLDGLDLGGLGDLDDWDDWDDWDDLDLDGLGGHDHDSVLALEQDQH